MTLQCPSCLRETPSASFYGTERCVYCGDPMVLLQRSMYTVRQQLYLASNRWKNTIFGNPFCDACEATVNLTIHHFVPIGKGGSKSSKNNRMVLCKVCHAGVHTKERTPGSHADRRAKKKAKNAPHPGKPLVKMYPNYVRMIRATKKKNPKP